MFGTGGEESCGFVSWPLTVWFALMSFLPVNFGLSLWASSCGFSCASTWFFELKFVVSSGTLSGASGFASMYLFGGGGLGSGFAKTSGAISMLNVLGAAIFRGEARSASVRKRYGTIRNRIRWTKKTAATPTTVERDSGSAQERVNRLRAAPGEGAVSS